jgi:hypothetical protein
VQLWLTLTMCCYLNPKLHPDPCKCGKIIDPLTGKPCAGPCINPIDDPAEAALHFDTIVCQECCEYLACVKGAEPIMKWGKIDIAIEAFNFGTCETICAGQ